MSETAPHKSHVAHWIISIVLALVLYLGSAAPVMLSFNRGKGPWLPISWMGSVETLYQPAYWLWKRPPLDRFEEKWWTYWAIKLHAFYF